MSPSLTASSSCIWWRGCEACGSSWCSWLWGNIRPPGQSRTCGAKWTRWFWSGRRQSFPQCSDDGLQVENRMDLISLNSVWLWGVLCLLYFTANKKALLHTGSKGHIGELLPCGRIIVEVAIRFELHPVHPGVVEPVVNSRGDAHLVAHRDGVSCCSLRKQKREQVQQSAEVVCAYTWHHKIQCWGMTHTWGERAILIIVMMGGRSRRVSFKQRSSKLRSFS